MIPGKLQELHEASLAPGFRAKSSEMGLAQVFLSILVLLHMTHSRALLSSCNSQHRKLQGSLDLGSVHPMRSSSSEHPTSQTSQTGEKSPEYIRFLMLLHVLGHCGSVPGVTAGRERGQPTGGPGGSGSRAAERGAATAQIKGMECFLD